MDPVLSSLFPVNQIGSDGFNWWIGQIESNKPGIGPKESQDPKNSGRYRVRIVGQHLKDCDATPTEELPWANVMMPVTTPFTDGGVTGATVDLRQGNWVIGFYMDPDKQKPIIMGSIGHTAGATLVKNLENDPNPEGTCKSFTTYFDPNLNPYKHLPLEEKNKSGGDKSKDNSEYTKVGQAGQIANAVPDNQSAAFYALFAENTSTNPTGSKICVEIANPKCGSESDLKGGLKNILSEMLAANQQSGGQLGSYYVSKVNGELSNYIDHGRKYIHKAVRLLKSFLARVKGEIVKLIKDGVDKLVELALFAETPITYSDPAPTVTTETTTSFEVIGGETTDTTNFAPVDELEAVGPVDPKLDINPIGPVTKKESRLKPVIDTINSVLDDLGCSMEDITDQIAQWITDLLFNFLMDAFNAAACLVDTLIEGILNEILALLETLISTVLGPLQTLLSVIANPIDLIGSAINQVLSLLGISCDGPGTQCEKVTKECVDCGSEETEDWLDKLIEEIESGPSAGTSVCDDAKKYPLPKETEIIFVGGIFDDPSPDDQGIDSPVPTTSTTPTSLTKSIIYSCSDISVVEGRPAVFTITRSGNTTVSSSIKYETISDSAVEDEDFIAPTTGGTIGFAPGEKKKTIVYRTLYDGKVEGTEKFFVRLTKAYTPQGIKASFQDKNIFQCEIQDYTIENLQPPPTSPGTPPVFSIPPIGSSLPRPVRTSSPAPSVVPIVPKYKVTSDKSFYFEEETITYTILTENIPANTELSYTLSGDIDENDIVGGELEGTFTIVNNSAQVTIVLANNNDDTVEVFDDEGNPVIEDVDDSTERIIFSIDNTTASTTALIIGENTLEPYYFVEADRVTVSEGETVTYTITTKNVADGTILNYTLSGDVTRLDIVEYELTGSFEINNNTAEVKIIIAGDGELENSELLIFTIDDTDASASVIILADPIPDEVEEQTIVPTFFVDTDKLEYVEGETVTYTIITTNVPDGTILQYSLLGDGITSQDIVGGELFGNFVVLNNRATVYVGLNDDLTLENSETLIFVINGTGASAQVVVLGDPSEPIQTILNVSDPCISPPTAGKPITDGNGAIISIPILDRGCPYKEPPRVIITGAGYGSSAIALLDNDGRVSEVRVTRTGRGYVKNTSDVVGLTCVIDSYTLLSPGRGYTSEPDVYINGQLGIAKARINEDGFVYSVEVLDRTKTFKDIPSIRIQGGGGFGARVLPSLNCLDKVELERKGYAKIGTGKYIDCP
jgi:hypothetical protein